MDFWERVKKDLQRGIKDGIGIVKEGVTIVKAKAGELTEEGKKRLKIFELKTKVQREISELGGKVYDLSSKAKNPLFDRKVKAVIARIKKLEAQIAKLEGQKGTFRKATSKRAIKSKRK
jgi:peptidoglycan hydrolase CwlO-like protein